jgi:hypothetical protein
VHAHIGVSIGLMLAPLEADGDVADRVVLPCAAAACRFVMKLHTAVLVLVRQRCFGLKKGLSDMRDIDGHVQKGFRS